MGSKTDRLLIAQKRLVNVTFVLRLIVFMRQNILMAALFNTQQLNRARTMTQQKQNTQNTNSEANKKYTTAISSVFFCCFFSFLRAHDEWVWQFSLGEVVKWEERCKK